MGKWLSPRSIHWKILLVCLVVVFTPLYLLNRYTISFFDKFTRASLENHLVDSAYIIGQMYVDSLADNHVALDPALQHRLEKFSSEIEAEINILNREGVVVHSSNNSMDVGRDYSARPEIIEALQGGYSARSMLTTDNRFMYYFCARPIKTEQGRVVGVAYLFRHTGPIVFAINQMVEKQRLTTGVAVLVSIVLALLLGTTINTRLRKLSKASADFARTHEPIELEVGGGDEIADLARSIQSMSKEIHDRNLYNRDFINTLMHELKMPLTAIKGASELLDQGAADKPAARDKFVKNIRYEVDRMNRMVWELNELSKLDIENLRGAKHAREYCTFVKEVCERFVPAFEPHAHLRTEIPAGPIIVTILPDRIEQVLTNLLDNAFRYTPPDGEIMVVVKLLEEGTVITEVIDNGPGVSAENLPKIFDRFFTTEPKDKPMDYGSGLGLSIAKTIVENHGGTLTVHSIPTVKTVFRFTLHSDS
jgi:signal transduction histidine kinase